ncbi:MAG: hypothetical protein ACTSO7_18725 [Candidatus Heimdallarchaeota archaeon]
MEEVNNNRTRLIISSVLVTCILIYTPWHMWMIGWDFTHIKLSSYLSLGTLYLIPLVLGLIIGFIAPITSHKIYAIVIATIIGIGFLIFDIDLLVYVYNYTNEGNNMMLFVVFGTILSIMHFFAFLFLCRKIRENYRKKHL